MASPVDLVRSPPDDLFSVQVSQFDGDRFIGSMPWDGRCLGPGGIPAVGALGVLVDEVLGYSLIASLPTGAWTISTEIWVDLVAPLPGVGARLDAVADTVQEGSYSSGEVRDGGGRLVALVRERGRRIADGPTGPGTVAEASTCFLDLADVLGARVQHSGHVVVPPSQRLANPRGVMHGGVSFAASELAAAASRLERASALSTSSVHIVQVRAVPLDVPYELEVETVHAGRSLWLSEVRGFAAGRLCTVARVTAE